jgi:hypothetical protein
MLGKQPPSLARGPSNGSQDQPSTSRCVPITPASGPDHNRRSTLILLKSVHADYQTEPASALRNMPGRSLIRLRL